MAGGEPQEFTGEPEKPAVATASEKEKDERQGLPPTVKVEHASAPMQLQQPDKKAKGPWIQYNGVGTVRVMTPQDWHDVGVDSDMYCEWNYLNHKRLPRSIFSDAQLQYLLRQDGRFSLVGDEKPSSTTK